jgi:hypothetical protein
VEFRVSLFDWDGCEWIHKDQLYHKPVYAEVIENRMHTLAAAGSISLILIVLWDAFEVIILPRRVTRKFRLARLFYRSTWWPWSWAAARVTKRGRRDVFLSFYGPVSLVLLLGVWAACLILGFACLHRALVTPIKSDGAGNGFLTYLYFSGSNFFTLGLGDVVAQNWTGRILTILEAGLGLGFLAIVVGYLPVLYQAFSRRELNISLLDARAGSPSTAAELLVRHFDGDTFVELFAFLRDWERWSAELLESHLSYPVLAYYRSQHSNQSWLAALTTILDVSALVMVGIEGIPEHQARLTFAMARHAVVDIAHVFNTSPHDPHHDRLPPAELTRLRENLGLRGIALQGGAEADDKLKTLRRMYEPYVQALSEYLLMPLPDWQIGGTSADNWQTSAWGRVTHV